MTPRIVLPLIGASLLAATALAPMTAVAQPAPARKPASSPCSTIPSLDKLRAVVGQLLLQQMKAGTCPTQDPDTGDISQPTQNGALVYYRPSTGYTTLIAGGGDGKKIYPRGTHWAFVTDADGKDDAYIWTTGEIDPSAGATTVNQQKVDDASAAARTRLPPRPAPALSAAPGHVHKSRSEGARCPQEGAVLLTSANQTPLLPARSPSNPSSSVIFRDANANSALSGFRLVPNTHFGPRRTVVSGMPNSPFRLMSNISAS
jgi:hypothetical protein